MDHTDSQQQPAKHHDHRADFSSKTVNRTHNNNINQARTLRAPATITKALPSSSSSSTTSGLANHHTKFSLIHPNNNNACAIGSQTVIRPLQRLQLATNQTNPFTALATATSLAQPQAHPRTSQIGGTATAGAAQSSGIRRSPQQQHHSGTVTRPSGLLRPTPVKASQLQATGRAAAASPIQATPATTTKLVGPVLSSAARQVPQAAATQAQLKPAVSASRLPTSTSAAFAAATAHHSSGGSGSQIRAILKPAISSTTITRPSATLAPSSSAGGLAHHQHEKPKALQGAKVAPKSQLTSLSSAAAAQSSTATVAREIQRQLATPITSAEPAVTSSTTTTSSSFQVINGSVNIDISSVQNDVSQIRRTLEQLVVILKSAQEDKEGTEKENELLRHEVVELKTRLRAIKSALAAKNRESNDLTVNNNNEPSEQHYDEDTIQNYNNHALAHQQRRGRTFLNGERAQDGNSEMRNGEGEAQLTSGAAEQHNRPSLYYSPMN